MSNRIGSSTIYISILPTGNKLHSIKLSREAKHRLKVIDYYLKHRNVSLTCRHFGISRSYFYKWYRRFNPRNLASLENKSCRPLNTRAVTYNTAFVRIIRKLRTDYPYLSSKKLAVIVRRDYGIKYSASTIGRIIKRFNLYFRAVISISRKRSRLARQVWKRRKPYNLQRDTTLPRKVIEFDMKHIYLGGVKQYAFVAIDVITKEALIHLATKPSSLQARYALEKVVSVFGDKVTIVNDNGSENYRHAYDYLKSHNITQYFARPHTPKDKPRVENFIGKLQQECLDEYRGHMTLTERAKQITDWLNDYHFFRPHQALSYQTPAEYCATLGITIHRRKVSTMY